MNNAELIRLLENILRQGVIFDVSAEKQAVRVQSGNLRTDWLRWNVGRAGAFKVWVPPAVGEQVWIGCPGGNPESAFLIGSAYSNDNPAPGSSLSEIVITAPDGASFRYDSEAGALEATGIQTAKISAAISINLDTPLVECSSHLKTKTFEATGGGTMNGEFNGNMKFNGIKPDAHDHGGVERGDNWTKGVK
ncbi:phage baseplate assembly protein V [Klebsiella aerogenes]